MQIAHVNTKSMHVKHRVQNEWNAEKVLDPGYWLFALPNVPICAAKGQALRNSAVEGLSGT